MTPSIRVAWLLAKRQIQSSSRWSTALVVFIMTLTFLNLVVVSGILVGLIEGAVQANRAKATGDLIITTPSGKNNLAYTSQIKSVLESLPQINGYTTRFLSPASIEANYRSQRNIGELPDSVGTTLVGFDPQTENNLTGIANSIIEGEFISNNETGYIVIGVNLLEEYLANFGNTDFQGLSNIEIGDKVLVSSNDQVKEFIVKGLLDDKAGDLSLRAYVTIRDFIELTNRQSQNANEIAIFVNKEFTADDVKQKVLNSDIDPEYAIIETWEEAQGQFIEDIKGTFSILGTIIGSIALVVASITIFIIVFINAISRRKYIGILKGIGIKKQAIALAYVIQSMIYAGLGSVIGLLATYFILVPYFAENPIDFPFSDGILVAPIDQTVLRLSILMLFTIIAGFVPAQIIIRKNTLDSILGR